VNSPNHNLGNCDHAGHASCQAHACWKLEPLHAVSCCVLSQTQAQQWEKGSMLSYRCGHLCTKPKCRPDHFSEASATHPSCANGSHNWPKEPDNLTLQACCKPLVSCLFLQGALQSHGLWAKLTRGPFPSLSTRSAMSYPTSFWASLPTVANMSSNMELKKVHLSIDSL
jgi:hypothetical protein